MDGYSYKVMKHFQHPKNVGEIKDADARGFVGNPVCGDTMTITLKVNNGKIADIKFKSFGCVSAIAASSALTELAKGKTLAEARKISKQDVADYLGGLPPIKIHCSILAVEALNKALDDFDGKKGDEMDCSCSCCGPTKKKKTKAKKKK
ncbi:MAG: iron-sulfur cluster assembly scaffold protein [Candidatus Micrarchaeota archaeon]